ncbi:MAG: hypothetical protein AB2374_02895 [Cytobacillus gottheilii]|uniref:hypothetical protein n=1 Tax=Cytobacillus gottheilii TaxID=859144 RepID=UPI0008366ED8|nr:hypothetical protein [Cytobacillus gottheilii]
MTLKEQEIMYILNCFDCGYFENGKVYYDACPCCGEASLFEDQASSYLNELPLRYSRGKRS